MRSEVKKPAVKETESAYPIEINQYDFSCMKEIISSLVTSYKNKNKDLINALTHNSSVSDLVDHMYSLLGKSQCAWSEQFLNMTMRSKVFCLEVLCQQIIDQPYGNTYDLETFEFDKFFTMKTDGSN